MYDDKTNNLEKNWLVKSSTRILGPFTFSEITEHLRSKQISIIDEVRLPEGRWSYIREHSLFMEVVRQIRDDQDSSNEQTMTHSIAQHTQTNTATQLGSWNDDLTPPPTSQNPNPPPAPRSIFRDARDREIKDVTPLAEAPQKRSSRPTSANSYGSFEDSRLQDKLRQKTNIIRWMLTGAAVLVLCGVFVVLSQKNKKSSLGYDGLVAQALRYKSLGLYSKSLQSYLSAAKIKEPDTDFAVRMAPILISEDRQSLAGRRILERALGQEGRSRNELMDAYLGIAVSYIMDGDLKQAEDTLQKAIGYEPSNVSALLNLAIIELKKGNYALARAGFDRIHANDPNSVLALFGSSLATIEFAKTQSDNSRLLKLIADIKASFQRTSFLRQELLIFQIYAQNLLGDVNGANRTVAQFLNQAPGQAKKFVYPLTVEWRFSQWDYIDKYCKEIYEKQPSHPELKSLRAVCLMEINRDADALKLITEALAEAPKNPYVLATQASYLTKLRRQSEAAAVLRTPELADLPIKNLLSGELCIIAQDAACAQRAFDKVYRNEQKNAAALYGLAWSVLQKKDRPAAYNYIRAGLQHEPGYLPLLELRDQLESE